MFRNSFQRGFLTVFYSVGSKPLELWEVHMENGHVSRLLDPDLKSMVLDIRGYNVSTAYITCPSKNRILGITMPFMIMIVKNLKKYFTFEVTIMDDTGTRRRFRVSNFQSRTQILPLSTAMPLGLADGWNQIQFNLAEFTRRAYGKSFVEVQRIKVNANIRLRRIYFTEKLTPEEDLPAEYRILLPLPSKKGKKIPVGESKIIVVKEPSKAGVTSQNMIKTVSRTSNLDVPPPVPAGVPEPPRIEAGPTADVGSQTTAPDEAPPEEIALVGEASEKGDVEGETSEKGDAVGETTSGKSEGEGETSEKGDAVGETTAGKSEREGETSEKDDAVGETTAGKSEGVGEGEATPGDGEAEAKPVAEDEHQPAD